MGKYTIYIYHGSFGRVQNLPTWHPDILVLTDDPLGRVLIESTSFGGWHLWVSRSGWVGLPWGLPCVQEIHSRRTCLEHSDCPVFSVSLPSGPLTENCEGMCWSWICWSNSTYRLQWYLPWKWGSSMAMFVYRRVRQMSFLAGFFICGIRCWGRLESPFTLKVNMVVVSNIFYFHP